ncbi:MAG: LUD domain-containing protein [Pseudomonadota bacterium]
MSASKPINAKDARGQVFAAMKSALEPFRDNNAKAQVQERLSASAPTLIPARADLDSKGRVELFIEQAMRVQTDVDRIDTYADMPGVIADYLRRHNLPMRLVIAGDDRLVSTDWSESLIEVKTSSPDPDDPVGLTTAFAGIAETGTLMLTSDRDHPTMLAFLPETAIVVVPTDRIARAYEDVMHAFRKGGQPLSRSINLITGPSRSGDIEQTLQLGAHGPKRLLILLVNQESDEEPIPDIDVSDLTT